MVLKQTVWRIRVFLVPHCMKNPYEGWIKSTIWATGSLKIWKTIMTLKGNIGRWSFVVTCWPASALTQWAYGDPRIQYNNSRRILLWLPWCCRASEILIQYNINDFAAIIKNRCASLIARVRSGRNSILSVSQISGIFQCGGSECSSMLSFAMYSYICVYNLLTLEAK